MGSLKIEKDGDARKGKEEMGFGEVKEEKWERTAVAAVTLGRRHRRPEERDREGREVKMMILIKWGGGSRTAKHKEEG